MHSLESSKLHLHCQSALFQALASSLLLPHGFLFSRGCVKDEASSLERLLSRLEELELLELLIQDAVDAHVARVDGRPLDQGLVGHGHRGELDLSLYE